VLEADLGRIWLSEGGSPQWVSLKFDGIPEQDRKGLVFRTIGKKCNTSTVAWFHCTTDRDYAMLSLKDTKSRRHLILFMKGWQSI
jgi:hypothetical protein